MFAEALADAGVYYGLARSEAYELAAKVIEGTGAMILTERISPAALKDAVCSPKGTTIKGVYALEKDGFRGSVMDAISAVESAKVQK
jgi:pyrroline-5-carboxylate reductase